MIFIMIFHSIMRLVIIIVNLTNDFIDFFIISVIIIIFDKVIQNYVILMTKFVFNVVLLKRNLISF
jgi:hypothetical protein